MARTYKGELPAKMVVLGLVVERPGETVSTIAQRLGERFDYAQWSGSTAHNTLPQLAKQDLARRVYMAPGTRRALDRYEATQKGLAAFRRWRRSCSIAPVALREAVHGQIELSEPEDLTAIIDGLRREQEVCTKALVACRTRLQSFEAAGPDPGDWKTEARAAVLMDQGLIWHSRVRRLARLRRRLEVIRAKLEDPAGGPGE
jgi:DNA-binding PadR family transcriptional regulator